MFSKVNVFQIVVDHIRTLSRNGRLSVMDILVFFGIPLVVSVCVAIQKFSLTKDSVSTLVTVGALFTGLLLSLLVLVYDQRSKLKDDHSDDSTMLKAAFLELYGNISYAILASIVLVCISFAKQLCSSGTVVSQVVDSALVFIGIHLALTILMILKRINITLTSKF